MTFVKDPLLTVDLAWENIKQHIPAVSLRSQVLPISQILGKYLAEPIIARCDVPPAPNSAMDGFACRVEDANKSLPIQSKHFAGQPAPLLKPGHAIRIFTGADLPVGANAVIAQESCTFDEVTVTFNCEVEVYQNIRPQGQDIQIGHCLFKAGHRVTPQDIGVIASAGIASVLVYRPLRLGLISTGDELVAPGTLLKAGQIYNSNQYALVALFTQMGFEVTAVTLATDNEVQLTAQMLAVAGMSDIVVSTGGVSVGEADFVKKILIEQGKQFVWRLALKPGKPLVYGQLSQKPFFGLPGNPVAAFVTALVFIRAFKLLLLQQETTLLPTPFQGIACFSVETNTRRELLRGTIGDENNVTLFANQSSGVLTSVSASNCLVDIPPHTTISPGDVVSVYLLEGLMQA